MSYPSSRKPYRQRPSVASHSPCTARSHARRTPASPTSGLGRKAPSLLARPGAGAPTCSSPHSVWPSTSPLRMGDGQPFQEPLPVGSLYLTVPRPLSLSASQPQDAACAAFAGKEPVLLRRPQGSPHGEQQDPQHFGGHSAFFFLLTNNRIDVGLRPSRLP